MAIGAFDVVGKAKRKSEGGQHTFAILLKEKRRGTAYFCDPVESKSMLSPFRFPPFRFPATA
jgi:hypothetical protein